MIKQNQRTLNILNLLSDAVLMFLSYYAALYLRFQVMDGIWSENLRGANYLWLIAGYCAAAVAVYYFLRVYSPQRYHRFRSEAWAILAANGICLLLLTAGLYVQRWIQFSRVLLLLYYCLSSFVVITKHAIVRVTLHYVRRMGFNLKHIIVVGSGRLARQYAENVRQNPQMGFCIDGYIGDSGAEGLGTCFGDYSQVREILKAHDADELVVALSMHQEPWMREIIRAANQAGIRTKVIPTYNDFIPPNPSIDVIGTTRLINLNASPLDNVVNAAWKRMTDIVFSLIGLILLSPLLLAIAVGVKMSSPGPVFFVQERVGRNKKTFKMLKFRSMRQNAEEKTGWSTDADPRKTVFGSFLRKTSLDELPQLLNVLVGQMSLVGPRPEVPFHVDHFQREIPQYLVRQQIRPGMTGWAQINGFRGDTDIEKRIEYDLWYINNWCIRLDIEILMHTIMGGFVNDERITPGGKGK